MVNVTGTDPAIAAAVDAAIAAGGAQTAGSAQDRQAWAQTSPTNFPSGGSGVGVNPALLDAALAAGQLAYNNARLQELEIPSMRLLDEREKERLRQEAFKNAYTKAFQQAQTTGYVAPEQGEGLNARATAAWNQLPPEARTPQSAVGIWKSLIPGLTDREAAALHGQTSSYARQTGTTMPDDVIQRNVAQVSGGRVAVGQTPTLAREQMQNDTMLALLQFKNQNRGPGDWASYMQSIASMPPEMRQLVDQAAGRFQMPGAATAGGMTGVTEMVSDFTTQAAPGVAQPMQSTQPVASMPLGTVARNPDVAAPARVPMVAQNGVATHENAVMNAGIRGAAGIIPATVPAAPVAPARFMTGTQLPRSFLGAGQDAQDFVLGNAESQGESRRQILDEFSRSLPQYQGSRRGKVRW